MRQVASTLQSKVAETEASSWNAAEITARRGTRSPHGAALVIVMLVMAVLLLAGTTFMTISSTESQIALNQRVSTQAFLLAEAALHKAIAQLNADSSYPGETNTSLSGGTFTVTVTAAPAAMQQCPGNTAKSVVARASMPVRGGEAQAQLQATVDQVAYPYRWGAFAAVEYVFVSSLNSTQALIDSFDSTVGPYGGSNTSAGGDVGANGDLYFYNAQVKGSVRAGGSVSISNSTVSAQASGVPAETFPAVVPSVAPTTGLTVSTGNYTLAPGSYQYTNMNFADNTSLTASGGPVTIYVTGQVTLGANVTLGSHPGTSLTIITKSDGGDADQVSFTAGSNFKLYGSLYGKNTSITLGNNAEIFGSMIGRRISRDLSGAWWDINGPNIHFDHAMYDKAICHNGRFNTLRGSWFEMIP